MSDREWIMSEGGALICMERRYMETWQGVDATSIESGAQSDYARASNVFDYVENLSLKDGQALVFGEGPLDTSAWQSDDGQLYLVRIFACENDIDIDRIIRTLQAGIFENPLETLDFSFFTPDLVLFDSAERGTEPAKDCLAFSIAPGRYKILTQFHNPDPSTSLILHRFDPIG